jgi:hypothetical protein
MSGSRRRGLEPDRLALADLLALGDALDADAVGLDLALQIVEVVLELDLERHPVEPHARVVPDREAVVVALVPALEEEAILSAFDQVESEHLRVVGSRELEVGSTDVDMCQPENSHARTVR